jgi:hypothetical protein
MARRKGHVIEIRLMSIVGILFETNSKDSFNNLDFSLNSNNLMPLYWTIRSAKLWPAYNMDN